MTSFKVVLLGCQRWRRGCSGGAQRGAKNAATDASVTSGERGWVPAGGVVLVHDQGADAFHEIALREAAVDEVQLQAEAVGEPEASGRGEAARRSTRSRVGERFSRSAQRLRGPGLELRRAPRPRARRRSRPRSRGRNAGRWPGAAPRARRGRRNGEATAQLGQRRARVRAAATRVSSASSEAMACGERQASTRPA